MWCPSIVIFTSMILSNDVIAASINFRAYATNLNDELLEKQTSNSLRKINRDTSITHYTDDDGIKVEKQIVDAVVIYPAGKTLANYSNIQAEVDRPSEKAEEWSNSEEDSFQNNYAATTLRASELENNNANERDDIYDADAYPDTEQTDTREKPEHSLFDTASNILDVYTALHTAWQIVQQHSAEMAKNVSQIEVDERSRRNSKASTVESNNFDIITSTPRIYTEVAASEARYIKGDPLKGYYDFVITEGSYKFWAAFQLATAALVIYSTFAAIYYSKVNPLVGDYDYVDYLGGGRSLSKLDAVDVDFSDPSDEKSDDAKTKQIADSPSIWSSFLHTDWVPKVGHTAKFILEAIDKIPQ